MNGFPKSAGALIICILIIAGCAPGTESTTVTKPLPAPAISSFPAPSEIPPAEGSRLILSTTNNSLWGNRVVEGSIDLKNATVLDIPVMGNPLWLVSGPLGSDALFVTVTRQGNVEAFRISGQSHEPFELAPVQLPECMPPLLAIADGNAQLVRPPQDASTSTNPLLDGARLIYIAANGDLVLADAGSQTRLAINALPDARILLDDSKRLLVLTGPTDRYGHGVLGDGMEASGITLIETEPQARVIRTIPIDAPDVIEGIAPIWADIDADGVPDILVTLSSEQTGARIVAFREDGTLLANGPALGLAYRWRHQIAFGEFEHGGRPYLVSVRTPHIGGVVEFFQLNNGALEIISEIPGFSSHSIGSRNLDSALAGVFNDDGVIELLVPDQSQTHLGIISPAGVIASIPLDGRLTSNISATSVDGRLLVGAATAGNLRLWIP